MCAEGVVSTFMRLQLSDSSDYSCHIPLFAGQARATAAADRAAGHAARVLVRISDLSGDLGKLVPTGD